MEALSQAEQSTHVVLYGPPGVGKLTVGRALAKLTGYKLAHNHLSIDFVQPIFDFGSPEFARLVDDVRIQMALAATLAGVSLIHTFVLLTDEGDAYLERLCSIVEDNGGRIEFVRLLCDIDSLKTRIFSTERTEMRKVRTLDMLQAYLDRGVLTKVVSGRESLAIDNTTIEPSETAGRIARHYDLPVIA